MNTPDQDGGDPMVDGAGPAAAADVPPGAVPHETVSRDAVSLDAVSLDAVSLDASALAVARSAAVIEAGDPGLVGDVVDVYAEDAVAVTARFQAPVPGYRGWLWSVTVTLLGDVPVAAATGTGTTTAEPSSDVPVAPGAPRVSCTVSEVVLLPGPDALLAPAWVPWEQRIRSGDLGVGDLLPPAPDDPRLVPAYVQSDDPEVERVAYELGLGRVRVLSREGRVDAAERWHDGAFGPNDDMAVHAPAHCLTCAFYLPLAGALGGAFGACGNEFSPADGRVVDAGYGCGAHSEVIGTSPARSATSDTVLDELLLEVHRHPAAAVGTTEEPAPGAGDAAASPDIE